MHSWHYFVENIHGCCLVILRPGHILIIFTDMVLGFHLFWYYQLYNAWHKGY